MLTFVCFLWQQQGYHTAYTDAHVRRWASMINKHYRGNHRFVVITDLPGDYGSCEVMVPPVKIDIANPHGEAFPSCYRRLWLWSDEAKILGDRICLMDLDCTIHADITDLMNKKEDVTFWRDPSYPIQPYNGGMILIKTGARTQVWDEFDGQRSINKARAQGYKGSDQAWIAYVLDKHESVWSAFDGIHSWKRDLRRGLPRRDTRITMFHGRDKPWHDTVQEIYR